jgi:Ca2+-binding RTX toxin-like protein
MVGGLGNDLLTAGSGRSILIGGKGADVLVGGGDDDILINGTTSYDGNATSLTSLMAEWKRTDLAYAQRIDHLMGTVPGGLNGSAKLTSATVTDDTDVDSLTGNDGLDWFWAPLSEVIDKVAEERVK